MSLEYDSSLPSEIETNPTPLMLETPSGDGSTEAAEPDAGELQAQNSQPEPKLCAACHKQEPDTSESPYSILCRDCRNRHNRLTLPAKMKVFLVVVAVVFAVSLFTIPTLVERGRLYRNAEQHMANHEYIYAYQNYYPLLMEYERSAPLAMKIISASMSAGYFDAATYFFNEYLFDKSLSDAEYAEAMKYYAFLNRYYYATDAVADMFGNMDANTIGGNDGLYQAILPAMQSLLQDSQAEPSVIHYYLGLLSPSYDQSLLHFATALDSSEYANYVYGPMGNIQRRLGDCDAAKATYETALLIDACNAQALRGLGVLQLLDGNKAEAVEICRSAYEINFEYDVLESYLISLCENGCRDEALTLLAQAKGEGFEPDDDLVEYLDGSITAWQYYGVEEEVGV